MAVVRVAHPTMLRPDDLRAIRALLDESFDDLTDDDYEHATHRDLGHRASARNVGYLNGER
jgi:hypothetical protein